MRSWNNLPSEIIYSICSHLSDYADLSNSQLTCTSWSNPVQRLIYSSIRLETIAQAILYIRTCLGGLGELATKIDVSDIFGSDHEYESHLLTCLAGICPNVTEFEATEVSSSFWVRLKQECTNGQFKYLEILPFPNDDKDTESYRWIVNHLHTRLTNLLLCDQVDDQDYIPSNNDVFWELAGRLKEFPKLNSLEITKWTNHNLFMFDHLILPSLTSLNFTANHHEKPTQTEIQQNNAKVDLSVIQPCPKIKNLEANSYIIYSDESINYFIHKFPQLKTLVLNKYMNIWYDHEEQRQSHDYRNSLTALAIARFIKFIFKIPSYILHNILTHNALPVLADYIQEEKYSGIIDINYNHADLQDVYYDADISIINTGCQDAQYYDTDDIHYHRPNSTIHIRYSIYNFEDIIAGDPRNPFTAVDLIKKCGPFIQHFSICDDYNLDIYDRSDEESLKSYINLVLSNCNILKSLSIECPMLSRFSPESEVVTRNTVEYVKLYSCKVEHGFLTDVSTRLPLLKHLCLSRCMFFNDEHSENSPLNRSAKIHMPDSSLDTISFYCREKGISLSNPVTKIYLTVETETSGVQYLFGNFVDGIVTRNIEQYHNGLENDKDCSIQINVRCRKIRLVYVRYNEEEPQTLLIDA